MEPGDNNKEVDEEKLHNEGTAPWLRRLRRFGLNPYPVHVRFVVDKVELRYDFLRISSISPASIIPPMLHALSLIQYRRHMLLAIDNICN
jgi:hypothetical protein